MIEIERKFLVKNDNFKHKAIRALKMTQGYLSKDPKRTVRIRISGEQAFITVKGEASKSGTSRFEWEKSILVEEAQNLIAMCLDGVINKIRHYVQYENHLFEVDEFLDDNHGLIVAEVELDNENEIFKCPEWLGKEVTGKKKYYNSQLSQNPFRRW